MRSITHRLDRCHAGCNARDIGGSLSSNTDTSGPISGTCTVNVVLGVSAVAVSIHDGPAMGC
ncbi:MAG TPA: hypothetical protein VFN29_06030 [Chiayiivirga sp.]|nr:hypothetical protein [Chiayiivirga sp.]